MGEPPGGSVDMSPDPTHDFGVTVGKAGGVLADQWRGARAAITGYDARIGTGPLAAKFRAGYGPATDSVFATADPIPEQLQQVAEVIAASVADYHDRDRSAADALRNGHGPR